jgi:hypothetical protein
MMVIDIPTLKQVVKEVVIRLNEPVMIEGQSGAGKSEAIAQATEEAGAVLCDIRLGQYDSVDMRGFPGVDQENELTRWFAPSTMPFIGNDKFPDDKPIVLFLDEITSASTSVFANSYQLINDFALGEHVLKPNVRIIAAGNRQSDKGVVNRMPAPLCNRMTWFEVVSTTDAWCKYAMSQGVSPMIIAFLGFRKNMLHTFNPEAPNKVFATPRTWMKAAKYFSDTELPETLKQSSIMGAIGEGPAAELMAFLNVWRKVLPIKKILADPSGVALPDEESFKYATVVSVSGALDAKTAPALSVFLKRLPPEYVVMAWQLALSRDKSVFKLPEFIDFARTSTAIFA